MSQAKLTTRESQVLSLIVEGLSTQEIAFRLGVTLFTVRKHRSNISAKFGIHTTSGLVSAAIRHADASEGRDVGRSRLDLLSDREKEVLRRLGSGLTAKEIARHLGISPRTVSKHIENIRLRTGLHSLADLMMIARQL